MKAEKECVLIKKCGLRKGKMLFKMTMCEVCFAIDL